MKKMILKGIISGLIILGILNALDTLRTTHGIYLLVPILLCYVPALVLMVLAIVREKDHHILISDILCVIPVVIYGIGLISHATVGHGPWRAAVVGAGILLLNGWLGFGSGSKKIIGAMSLVAGGLLFIIALAQPVLQSVRSSMPEAVGITDEGADISEFSKAYPEAATEATAETYPEAVTDITAGAITDASVTENVSGPVESLELSEYLDQPVETMVDAVLSNNPGLTYTTRIDEYDKKHYNISNTLRITSNGEEMITDLYIYDPDTKLYIYGYTVGESIGSEEALKDTMEQYGFEWYEKGSSDGYVQVYYKGGKTVFYYYDADDAYKIHKIMWADYDR